MYSRGNKLSVEQLEARSVRRPPRRGSLSEQSPWGQTDKRLSALNTQTITEHWVSLCLFFSLVAQVVCGQRKCRLPEYVPPPALATLR